jgi:hypothetical protein
MVETNSLINFQAEKILEIQAALEKKEKHGPQKMEDFLRGELRAVSTLQSGKGDSEDLIIQKNPRDYQVEEELRLLMIENGILGSSAGNSVMVLISPPYIRYGTL